MAMVVPFIFQIVGYQNSGKTTFLNRLIQNLDQERLLIGTIKHHGHGGKPEINEQKDSASYLRSGASVSLVEGEGRIVLQAERHTWTLREQIKILESFHLDLIFIEGYKFENYSKALILNNEQDIELLTKLKNIVVVIYRDKSLKEKLSQSLSIPYHHIEEIESINWIIHFLKSHLKAKK